MNDFSFYVKNAEPQTNGLVIGSLKPDGSPNTIIGPSPISTFSWLNTEIRRCLFSYQDIYRLKQAWEPRLDQIPAEEMESVFRLKLRLANPVRRFFADSTTASVRQNDIVRAEWDVRRPV